MVFHREREMLLHYYNRLDKQDFRVTKVAWIGFNVISHEQKQSTIEKPLTFYLKIRTAVYV